MTTETTTTLSPAEALEAAKRFFIGEDAVASAWVEAESDSHISFATFRGNLAVAAFPASADGSTTRVRITTLREEGAVSRLVTFLRTQAPDRASE